MSAVQRYFALMPLMHSEQLATQEEGLAQFETLARKAGPAAAPPMRKFFASGPDYSKRHRDIIARFGRFPHRNEILGRESTEEERRFLTQPGSSF